MLYGLGAMGLVTTILTYHHAVWFGCYGIGHYHLQYHHAVWFGCYGIGHYHLHLSPCCMVWVLWDWSLQSSLITMLYGLGAMGLVTTIFSITMLYGLGAMGLVTTIFSITMLYGLGAMGLVTTIFTYHHAVWFECYGIGHYNLHLSPCCMVWELWDWSLPSSVSPCCMVWELWDWSLPSSVSPCCMVLELWDWSLPSSLITMLYGLGAMGLVTTIFSITMLYGLDAMGLVTTIFTYHHAVWFGSYGIGHYHLHLSPCCMVWVLWDWSLQSYITMLYGLGAMGLVTTIFTYHHAVWFGSYGIGHYSLHLSQC